MLQHQLQELAVSLLEKINLKLCLGAVAIILGSFLTYKIGNTAINRFFLRSESLELEGRKRAATIATLLKSFLRYTIYFVAIVIFLGLLGVNTGTLLAGAGLVGLAISFGAKNLIQDVLTGFFILFEDQFAVGDYITAAGVSGVVEEIGLRTTRLKDTGGQVHYIPNGRIFQVTNYSRSSLRYT